MNIWIISALLAGVFNFGKYFSAKHFQMNSWLLMLVSRIITVLLMLPFLMAGNFPFPYSRTFWVASLITCILTIIAGYFYLNAVKSGPLSLVAPIQSLIPVFMIITTALLGGEYPHLYGMGLICIICLSIFHIVYAGSRKNNLITGNKKPVCFSLLAALLFGISTVIDRIAVNAVPNGALVYTFYWSILCGILLIPFCIAPYKKSLFKSDFKPLFIYALCTFASFLLQQKAVQLSFGIANNVTYIKTLIMLHIIFLKLAGVIWFREPLKKDILFSGTLAVVASAVLVTII